MLYFGSCRYMYEFEWNSFLGRVHTTREIGATISMIGEVLEDRYPKPILTYLFGDLGHPGVGYGYNGTGLVRDQDLKSVKDIIIEVSSNIVQKFYINKQPVYGNTHYLKRDDHMKDTYTASETITLSPQDIERDIGLINTLIKDKFHPEANLHVIPPLNLKLSDADDYIESRVTNTRALEEACIQHKVNFCNIGKHLEDVYKNPTLQKFQPTGAWYEPELFDKYIKPYLESIIILP